jgi:hypothetical protein
MERAFDRGQRVAKTKAQKQETLFETFETDAAFKQETQGYPDVTDWPMIDRLRFEKELTGYWLSMHPVEVHPELVAKHASVTVAGLAQCEEHSRVAIAAVVTGKRVVKTKTDRFMGILQLEDATGKFEAVLFPGRPNRKGQFEQGPFELFQAECEPDLVALFVGQVEFREQRRQSRPPAEGEEDSVEPADLGGDDEGTPVIQQEEQVVRLPSLQISSVIPMSLVSERLTRDITLALSVEEVADQLPRMQSLFAENDGDCPVTVLVHLPDGVALTLQLGSRWKVRPTSELLAELRRLWGADRVIVHASDPLEVGRERQRAG